MVDKGIQRAILVIKREAKGFSRQRNRIMTTYSVIDSQTKAVVGKPYNDRTRAHRAADKMDLQYGAVRYQVKVNYSESGSVS